jgi:hypothetical protein
MKTHLMKSILRAVLVLSFLVGGTRATTWAQSANSIHDRIVGLWDVQVTQHNCSTGVPLASFSALHKYELGGTAQIVPATNPTALSAHLGVWTHVQGNDYQLTFKMFRFDGAGHNIGWIVVKNDVTISEDAELYAGSGQAEFFDMNGNLQGSSCPEFTGTRLQ